MQRLVDFHYTVLRLAFLDVVQVLLPDVERSVAELPDGFDLWHEYASHGNEASYLEAHRFMDSFFSGAKYGHRDYMIVCDLFLAMKYVSKFGHGVAPIHQVIYNLTQCRQNLYLEEEAVAWSFIKSILVRRLGEFA